MIRKEAWPFYRTISGVRLCWELEEPKGPKGAGLHQEDGAAHGESKCKPSDTLLVENPRPSLPLISRPMATYYDPLRGYLFYQDLRIESLLITRPA